jgi:hypothetical protein
MIEPPPVIAVILAVGAQKKKVRLNPGLLETLVAASQSMAKQ